MEKEMLRRSGKTLFMFAIAGGVDASVESKEES